MTVGEIAENAVEEEVAVDGLAAVEKWRVAKGDLETIEEAVGFRADLGGVAAPVFHTAAAKLAILVTAEKPARNWISDPVKVIRILEAESVKLDIVAQKFDDDLLQAVERSGEEPSAGEMGVDLAGDVFAVGAGFRHDPAIVDEERNLVIFAVGQAEQFAAVPVGISRVSNGVPADRRAAVMGMQKGL